MVPWPPDSAPNDWTYSPDDSLKVWSNNIDGFLSVLTLLIWLCDHGCDQFLMRCDRWLLRRNTTLKDTFCAAADYRSTFPLQNKPSRTMPLSSPIHLRQQSAAVRVFISTYAFIRLQWPRQLSSVLTYTEWITYWWWWMMIWMVHPRHGSNFRIGYYQRPPTWSHSNGSLIPLGWTISVGIGGARGRIWQLGTVGQQDDRQKITHDLMSETSI